MRLGYTEFSFGYAFTENLIRAASAKPAGAPVFPNLIQEAQLGYDVHIDLPGCPLFFQYKLPELMVRDTAKEISQYALAGMSTPFFRMPLMRRDLSQQHQLLVDLEQRFGNAVFYATPGMEDVGSFNAAYSTSQVHNRSVFFSPSDIGPLADDKQHVIAYRNGLGYAWFCSVPREVSAVGIEEVERKLAGLFDESRYQSLDVAADDVREGIFELASPQIRASADAIRQRVRSRIVDLPDRPAIDDRTREVAEELLVTREIARVGLGVEMIIAQRQAD